MYDAQQYGGGRGGAAPSGNSPGSKAPAKPGAGRAPIPLRPVTIRMLLEAQRVGDGALVISGAECGSVTIAGRIIASEGAATGNAGTARSHTYHISDGTGLLTVKHWLDSAPTEAAPEPEAPGAFVTATGNVKVFQDKPQLTGAVRILNDANEFTFHLLDAVQVHLRLTLGDRAIPGAKSKTDGVAVAASAGSGMPAAGAPSAGGAVDSGLDAILHRVMMSVTDRATGISAEDAHTRVLAVQPHVSLQEVKQKLAELTTAGFYFPTSTGNFSY